MQQSSQRLLERCEHSLRVRGQRSAWVRQWVRSAPQTWLVRPVLALGSGIVLALFWINAPATPPIEGTVRLERLAAKLQRARIIPHQTEQEIARLIASAAHDCERIECSPKLAQRNQAVRDQLKLLLAKAATASWLSLLLSSPFLDFGGP